MQLLSGCKGKYSNVVFMVPNHRMVRFVRWWSVSSRKRQEADSTDSIICISIIVQHIHQNVPRLAREPPALSVPQNHVIQILSAQIMPPTYIRS